MVLRNRFKEQQVRMILMAVLILTGIYSVTLQAQSIRPVKYLGLEASFGVRSFVVNSNIEKINQMHAAHEGGTIGVVFGNELMKARIAMAGVYYSNANTPRTQQLFESAALVNFYPMAFMKNNKKAKLHPYLVAGFSITNIKFFGTYVDNQNSRMAYEPYLGKVSQVNVQGGIGLEYRLMSRFDFVHLFAQASYGAPVQSKRSSAFSQTTIKQCSYISVGVSFGRHR